jgi:tRNA dimethylallyltransferase
LAAVEPPLTPVLVGPTASGKTLVALGLAERLTLTVISADARQVYRGLDIGTAKPSAAARERVPHLGVDLVAPGERYSAGRFGAEAAGWLVDVRREGRLPLVVGGTGFYIRALADGLFREPPLESRKRDQLREWTARLEMPALVRWAGRLDPGFAGGGRQRAVRAVEVALLSGRALSWWQREARETGAMRPWYIQLTLPRDVLHRRIAGRVDAMLADGLIDEVRGVLAQGVPADAPGLDGVGYREVVAVLQGRLPQAALREAMVIATRQYAKRQETWFRHQLSRQPSASSRQQSVWKIDATIPAAEIAEMIQDRWLSLTADR